MHGVIEVFWLQERDAVKQLIVVQERAQESLFSVQRVRRGVRLAGLVVRGKSANLGNHYAALPIRLRASTRWAGSAGL